MKEFTYTIKEPVGIHARPAGMLAKEAKTCQSTVTIVDKNGKSVDATRLMALMGMGIKCGDTVTVKIEGADEETAAPAMEKFFNEHLYFRFHLRPRPPHQNGGRGPFCKEVFP